MEGEITTEMFHVEQILASEPDAGEFAHGLPAGILIEGEGGDVLLIHLQSRDFAGLADAKGEVADDFAAEAALAELREGVDFPFHMRRWSSRSTLATATICLSCS